jgi:hypothetical protein
MIRPHRKPPPAVRLSRELAAAVLLCLAER